MKIQKHFKYTSNTKSNWWQWMINDIYEIKKDYNNAVKIIEKECSELIDNYLTNRIVSYDDNVLPSIALKSTTCISSGDGTVNNPYVVIEEDLS